MHPQDSDAGLDAAEAFDQAAHQALKDSDREPDRWPRAWRLTSAGRAYLEGYRAALAQLEAANAVAEGQWDAWRNA